MPVTEHFMTRSREVRMGMARQREALVGASMRDIVSAIVDPSPELARAKLRILFGRGTGGLIPRVGRVALNRALADLEQARPLGRRWHSELRLDELTRDERSRFMRAIVRYAPRKWREAPVLVSAEAA